MVKDLDRASFEELFSLSGGDVAGTPRCATKLATSRLLNAWYCWNTVCISVACFAALTIVLAASSSAVASLWIDNHFSVTPFDRTKLC